jgi:hypothetical protein
MLFKKYTEEDKERAEKAKRWQPLIRFDQYGNRVYMVFGRHEFAANYVEEIYVEDVGKPPSAFGPYPASPSVIRVSLSSGRHIDITCNRHQTEILLEGLRSAHKEGLELAANGGDTEA